MRMMLAKRKKYAVWILGIGLLVFCITYFVRIQTGRDLSGYLFRRFKGEYETYIAVNRFDDSEVGYFTQYAGDRYLYFDDNENVIYDFETKEALVKPEQKINSFCANERYIFYVTGTKIVQCGFDGSVHGMIDLPNDMQLSFIYVDERNLCCRGEKGVYILSAQNIRDKKEVLDLGENSEKKEIQIDGSRKKFWIESIDGVLAAFHTERLEDIKIMDGGGYIRIYTDRSDVDLNVLFMSPVTGKEVAYRDAGCMGIFEGELYFIDDGIYSLTEDNQCIRVKDSPLYEDSNIQYLSNIRSGTCLVILGESYYGHMPGESSGVGSIGDFMGANICILNMEKKKVLKEYHINEGQVIYMSETQYATIKDGIVKFYRMKDNALVKTKEIERYQAGQSYTVEACHDKLFFIGEKGLLEVIDI